MKTLIRGGCVLTLGAKTPNFPEADVLIEDGRVAEVGRGLRARDAEVVDATDAIIMPGFVDTHRHAGKSLLRNLGVSSGDASAAWLRYQPEDVYAATLIGLLGAVEAGITTVVDWSDTPFNDASGDAALQAHADAGLRTVLVRSDRGEGASNPALARRWLRSEDPAPPLTTIAFGSEQPVPGDLDRVAGSWALARELGIRIHLHVGPETARGLVADLAGANLLGEDVTLIHCSNLDGGDFDAIASSGTSVSLASWKEMADGHGLPPIQKLIDRGIRPGLGVGDERMAPGDLFAPMRATISLQHATLFDLKLAGKGGVPSLLSTREVIRYATVDGARVAGLGAETGSLEPGKQADLIVLRTDRPNIFPINDAIGAVVWGMDTSNLDWVFAGGRALMRNGVLEADVERARNLAISAQQRLGVVSGLTAGATAGRTG